jgi:hypothetical protein
VSAALDGGTEVCVFLLTFAVDGGSGTRQSARSGSSKAYFSTNIRTLVG